MSTADLSNHRTLCCECLRAAWPNRRQASVRSKIQNCLIALRAINKAIY